jgi:hypothetical protein
MSCGIGMFLGLSSRRMQMQAKPMIEKLEARELFAITTDTSVVKVPGPTDTVVIQASNPAGNPVPGQSSTLTLSNKDAKAFR